MTIERKPVKQYIFESSKEGYYDQFTKLTIGTKWTKDSNCYGEVTELVLTNTDVHNLLNVLPPVAQE